jgi:Subtilase family
VKRRSGVFISLGLLAFALAACGGGGGGSLPSGNGTGGTPTPTPHTTATPTPTPTPTPTATPITPSSASLYCTTQGSPQSIVRRSAAVEAGRTRRLFGRSRGAQYVPGSVEVVYARSTFAANRAAVQSAVREASASEASTMDFAATGRVVQVLRVPAGQEDATMAKLRANPLVQSVSRTTVRHLLSTNASSAFTNDPFFVGLQTQSPPLYQDSTSGGQWDMHVICAANAWAYGKPNGFGTFANALGGTAAIAIIDTGADMTHPELSGGRVVYSESVLNGNVTPGPVTDGDGHGTDVAGIAAATGNNNFGFTGVAYNAPLMIFKVFPDPPCSGGDCTASTSDVATAINDAVSKGAKVINMSLGGSMDPVEENAVAAAIQKGVVVVAASGNESHSTLDYPAADQGVIAVGASGLNDSTSTIYENVASYSNYDASHPTSWGVVAPGGNAADSSDGDPLHWIENIYSSTATTPAGACRPDPGASGPNDCRILITGTSMASPHVAGAASLLLSVKSTLTPAQVLNAICSTATQIADPKAGCGRLNVYKAMAQVLGDPSP